MTAVSVSGEGRRQNGAVLKLGSLQVATPVVLAPMAGITNAAYRRLCAEQGAGLYVCEMITSRAGRARPAHPATCWSSTSWRRCVGAALRHRPGLCRQGHRDPVRGVRRRARRPQLRLSGPQGDPQGRRWRAAVEAHAPRRDPRARRRRGRAVRRAGDDEDPQGHRRGAPDLPRRRPDRRVGGLRRDRAARADRGAGLLRCRRLGGHRPAGRARRHPGARQRRHLGGRRRAADGRGDRCGGRGRRTGLPGPALAVPRPRRGLRRRGAAARCRRWARCRT